MPPGSNGWLESKPQSAMLGGYGNRRIFLPTFIITTIDSILIIPSFIITTIDSILIMAALIVSNAQKY